jgi:hypothetical protein
MKQAYKVGYDCQALFVPKLFTKPLTLFKELQGIFRGNV